MPENSIRELIDKLLRGQCTEEEQENLFMLIQEHEGGSFLQSLLEDAWKHYEQPVDKAPKEVVEAILRKVYGSDKVTVKPVRQRNVRWMRIAATVAVLVMLSVSMYVLVFQNRQPVTPLALRQSKQDIAAPQTNKAILTLANGKNIVLDSAANGTLALQGGTQIRKSAEGDILYAASKPDGMQKQQMVYNTLTVPRGSKPVQLILADGSKVWLDVASSVTYPVAFIGSKREVSITGEAYFEVAKNAAKPFVVKSNNATVEVLGTRFNINAYKNEHNLSVTLLDGSVRVRAKGSGQSAVISPGQQVQVNENTQLKIIKNANTEEAMAWKNGRFIFTGIPIQAIMRQVERWYDMEVEYRGTITKEDFVGYISRYADVSALLIMLEKTRLVRFEIEGRRIIVKPYK